MIESEAEVVREVFELYAKELWSIGAIARQLNDERGVRTRLGRGPWERSTIWGMLRNPAYQARPALEKLRELPGRGSPSLCEKREGFRLDPALIVSAQLKSGLRCLFLPWSVPRALLWPRSD